jgi:hypothetical protein
MAKKGHRKRLMRIIRKSTWTVGSSCPTLILVIMRQILAHINKTSSTSLIEVLRLVVGQIEEGLTHHRKSGNFPRETNHGHWQLR